MNSKQKILLAFTIVGLFSLLLFIVIGENGLADLNMLKRERDNLLKENAELTQVNLSISREIERLKYDPKYIENIARCDLGMTGKDEVIFSLKISKEAKKIDKR